MDWNKDHIRETMLLLETAALHSARENYLDYVSTARLDRSEPIENDELAQAEVASDFAEALDDTLGTVAKLAMRQPFVLFKGLTFQKLCLPGAFRPGDHHNKMLRPGLCVVHASPQYL